MAHYWHQYSLNIPSPYDKQDAIDFVRQAVTTDWDMHPMWAVIVADKVIGGVNIHFFHGHESAEIGYGVARSHWGQGLTTEAMSAVLNAAFQVYTNLLHVCARADAANTGSVRVMQKLGLRHESTSHAGRLMRGQLRDEVVYGIMRPEW